MEIVPARHVDLPAVRGLFLEYATALDFSLCFQGFDEELAGLPGDYAAPDGAILLAHDRLPVGCVALRRFEEGVAEMKRLYVQPVARGRGIGAALVDAIISVAKQRGYRRMRLDTVPSMVVAQQLYESRGFRPITAYRHNPLSGALYFEMDLLAAG